MFNCSTCPNEKLLGVTLTNTLCCGTHIENVLKTCSYMCMLSRHKMFFEYSKTKSVFNSYTLTHLDYSCIIWGNCSCIIWGNCSCIICGNCSCIIWGNCSESSGDKLIKFQKCVIVNKPTETPSAECFTKLRWMTFPERVHFQKALKAYKK